MPKIIQNVCNHFMYILVCISGRINNIAANTRDPQGSRTGAGKKGKAIASLLSPIGAASRRGPFENRKSKIENAVTPTSGDQPKTRKVKSRSANLLVRSRTILLVSSRVLGGGYWALGLSRSSLTPN